MGRWPVCTQWWWHSCNDYEVPQDESKEPVYINIDCAKDLCASPHASHRALSHVFAVEGIITLQLARQQPMVRLPVVTSQPSGLFRAPRNQRRRWGDRISRPLQGASLTARHSTCKVRTLSSHTMNS